MKAVLLAAGMGTRLRPITNRVPKCLVPINGTPLLDIWLAALTACPAIESIYINTHYLHQQVERHLLDHWSQLDHLTCWYEPELLGTAGTLKEHAEVLHDNDVLVIHADNLSVFPLDEFIAAHRHRPAHCAITMMLFETDAPSSCGIVELDNNNTVTAMHEKVANPPGKLANAAVYICSAEIIRTIESASMTDFSTEVIPRYLGKIQGWINSGYHRDIGTPESLARANLDFQHTN